MQTRKCDNATQTGSDLMQVSESETQTGATPQKATSNNIKKESIQKDNDVVLITCNTPFRQDNFGWWEEERSI